MGTVDLGEEGFVEGLFEGDARDKGGGKAGQHFFKAEVEPGGRKCNNERKRIGQLFDHHELFPCRFIESFRQCDFQGAKSSRRYFMRNFFVKNNRNHLHIYVYILVV